MDDSMATPVHHLNSGGMAAPMQTVKRDYPTQGGQQSYEEILNSMQPSGAGNRQPPPTMSPTSDPAPMYNPSVTYDPTCPPGYDPNPPGAYTHAQEQSPYENMQYSYPPPPAVKYAPPPGKKAAVFGQYRDVILVAGAVFFLLFWAQPKARNAIPQLFSSTGGLNILGMLAVGVSAGLIFRVESEYLPN